jgi:hypothetical protein
MSSEQDHRVERFCIDVRRHRSDLLGGTAIVAALPLVKTAKKIAVASSPTTIEIVAASRQPASCASGQQMGLLTYWPVGVRT